MYALYNAYDGRIKITVENSEEIIILSFQKSIFLWE